MRPPFLVIIYLANRITVKKYQFLNINVVYLGGHVNPIVTVTLASMRKFPLNKVAHYLVAQYLGAFMGAALVYGLYNQTLSKFDEQRMKTNTSDDIYPSRGVFATYPINDINMMTAILDQLVNCAIFMMLIMAATDEKGLNVPKPFIPLAIGLTIIGISVGLGFNCGASLNPARDFAPRLFTLIAGYGSNVFEYIYIYTHLPVKECVQRISIHQNSCHIHLMIITFNNIISIFPYCIHSFIQLIVV